MQAPNDTSPLYVPQARIVTTAFERDPGKRVQICELPPNKQDEARRFYISEGSYQLILSEYPFNESHGHRRRFKSIWFNQFSWLEYSSHTDRVYCLPCFIFSKKPNGRAGSDAFTVTGFNNWKKVNDKDDCPFLKHMGKNADSAHNFSVRCFINLKNSLAHIDSVINKQKEKDAANERLRFTTTIDAVRGHDETPQSLNRGNFLEMVKLLACYNKEVKEVVLENAPGNAKYTSHEFCIMVDESRDESKKEQMAIVVRFVNKGLIQERFLALIHVTDTVALTLKDSVCVVLADNNLSVQDIRGQGYDGASNMRGEWNGLKAFILKECPYAYYIHCMAHQLQLALVAASREVSKVHNFFQHANFIINFVSASPKRNDELLANQAADIALLRSVAHDRLGTKYSRGDVAGALKLIVSFDFVFVLFLMEKIMKTTDVLCQILQKKSLDILNAMDCWEPLLEEVNKFCEKHEIDIPDLNQRYVDVTKSLNKHDNTTVLHQYKVDVFNVAIDQQLVELDNRFSSQATELLALCASLDPRLDSFDISKINKASAYPMVDRLLRLVLTLPVSTATAERAFSAMRLVKTCLRNKMGDDFLHYYMIVYIEKELAGKISGDDLYPIQVVTMMIVKGVGIPTPGGHQRFESILIPGNNYHARGICLLAIAFPHIAPISTCLVPRFKVPWVSPPSSTSAPGSIGLLQVDGRHLKNFGRAQVRLSPVP
ncbi:hypothetical protein BS78_06G054800 [Paspalum vaginatum]|nr:hypothetical protein BS78_06G054800 [Paspalum vaginatum]